MPKRFDLKFMDKDGSEKLALVVHRSSIGAIERSAAFLLEHFNGALPIWLSPVQVAVLPVSEKVAEYAKEIGTALKEAGIRYEIAEEAESLGKNQKRRGDEDPLYVDRGEKEAVSGQVSVRAHGSPSPEASAERGQKDLGTMDLAAFVEKVKKRLKPRLCLEALP